LTGNDKKRTIPYAYPLMPDIDDYKSAIQGIWENHYLTNYGPKLTELEEKLSAYLGVPNIGCFVNGHLALDCAIKLLGLTGEVVTTPFTFISTIQAVVTNGLKPVFCDIEPETFNIDPKKVESCITEKTSAILAVHVFGRPCDTEALEGIAKKHRLKLIYDAAHAFGVRYEGRSVLTYGDISMISFHATKCFNTIEGGALAVKDKTDLLKLKSIGNFGFSNGQIEYIATNAKMNEFQACMGLLNLKLVDAEIAHREKVYRRYNEKLAGLCGIKTPSLGSINDRYNYSYYPILIDRESYGTDSGGLFERLEKKGVISRRYFYPACNEMPLMKSLGYTHPTPIASRVSKNILTLPIHGNLSPDDVDYICAVIRGEA
jgi:dTDP-4-amino-4,6-dideoxygalactose transaminase